MTDRAPQSEEAAFPEALAKLVSVSRAELQKRLAQATPEKSSRRKRYKYVPAAARAKA